MVRSWGRRLVFAGLIAAAFAVLVQGAGAVVVHPATGGFLGVTPINGVSSASLPGSVVTSAPSGPNIFSLNGNLDYHGGPVVHSVTPYLIVWDPGSTIDPPTANLINRYFTDLAADSGGGANVFGVDRQFPDATGFADYAQTYSSAHKLLDTDSYPTLDSTNCQRTSGFSNCITDAQLRAEVKAFVDANGLPNDGSSAASELSDNAPLYFVLLPTSVNVCFGGSGTGPTTCSDNKFCAYHSSFTDSSNSTRLLYAALPTWLAFNDAKGCQFDNNTAVQEPNATAGDVVVKYTSHEYSEAVTDPLGNAYWDSASGNEDGDNCNFYGATANPNGGANPNAYTPTLGGNATPVSPATYGTLFNQLVNGNEYYTQSEWSNGDVGCLLRPSAGTVTPSFTVPAGPNAVNTLLNFDPSASTSTNALTSASWDFGDGSHAFNASGHTVTSTLAAVAHSYSSPGAYHVKLTLVDNRGNLQTLTQTVDVGSPPSAAFSVVPAQPTEGVSASFSAAGSSANNPGGTIASYSWSFGDGTFGTGATPTHTYATAGNYTVTLTVTDNFGLASPAKSSSVNVLDQAPTASFTAPHGHAGQSLAFSGSGHDPDEAIAHYAWSFGDGSTATGASAHHTFAHAGTFTVTLTVTDASGRSGSTAHNVVLTPVPCVVPNVKGKTLAAARTAIKAAHCSVGTVKRHGHRHHKVVKSQSPSPGKVESPGAKVNLTLA
jgi:PKD repeat protein